MGAYQTIISLLPQLSDTERTQVKQALGALNSVGSSTTQPSNDADTVLAVLVDQLRFRGVEFAAVAVLKRTSQYPAFCDKIPSVIQFLGLKNRVALTALLAIGIRYLYDDLTEMGISVSSRTMMAHIHRLPATFNKHFPQYASSGILHMLLKTKEQNNVRG